MAETSNFEMSSSSSSTPADCRFGLELTKELGVYDVPGRQQAWRLRVTVTDYYNVDPNIFVYLRSGTDDEGNQEDTFEAVASPTDLEEYPSGAPRESDSPQFFRLAEVDLLSRSEILLEETWDGIVADRDELIRTLVGICELQLSAVDRGGYFPPTPAPAEEEDEEPEGSEEAVECPPDAYASLTVTESNDPEFPVGSDFAEVGVQGDVPLCRRTWRLTGVPSGEQMDLTTSLVDNTFTCDLDGSEVDSGNISDEYKTYIYYTRDGVDHYTLLIEGVESSS